MAVSTDVVVLVAVSYVPQRLKRSVNDRDGTGKQCESAGFAQILDENATEVVVDARIMTGVRTAQLRSEVDEVSTMLFDLPAGSSDPATVVRSVVNAGAAVMVQIIAPVLISEFRYQSD